MPKHEEVPLADDGQLEALVARRTLSTTSPATTAAYVLSVGPAHLSAHRDARLGEILGLVEALDHPVVGQECLTLARPHPRTHLGPGVAQAVAERARAAGATLLVLDAPLSPSQTRNLEDLTGMAVSDREIVILGVFLRHARTRSARIQVEIARLEYLRPRIRGLGLDMDQQAGAGTYSRGAGETASELLARQLDERLVRLRRAFRKLERSGEERRKQREDALRIALVGYTNAGKSSLMNALSGADVSTRSRPFETLDTTTTRCLTRHGTTVLLADTVGFIRDLPERLLASFSSTLAEARESNLLAVVVDLSDPEWPLHLATTEAQLEAIQAEEIPRLYLFNKADLVDGAPPDLEQMCGEHPSRVVSSRDRDGMDALRQHLIDRVREAHLVTRTLHVPYESHELQAAVYGTCRVLRSEADEAGLTVTFQGSATAVARVLALAPEAP